MELDFPVNIRQFLPHRKPMLMVDEVIQLDDRYIETNFWIEESNIFNENGLFNAIGVIENAAQTCSGIVGWPYFELNNNDKNYKIDGFIAKIQSAEIYQLPEIKSQIITKGELISMHPIEERYNCKMDCKTYFNHQLIAHSIFTLIIQP